MTSVAEIPPGLWLIGGAVLTGLLPCRFQGAGFLLFPALALAAILFLPEGTVLTVPFLKYELVLCQVDALSRAFGIIFALIALVGGIYSFHIRATGERVAALLYAGGALGVTFAGDLFTLLLFWELMAVASTYLIWARRTPEAIGAGLRYLIYHFFGGSLLFAGIALHLHGTGSLSVAALPAAQPTVAMWLMLAGVAVNAAIPPLHAWLQDSYPKATITGAVFLSAFTTKSAVYVLARMYPGWEILLWLGVIMTLWGVTYAVLANDIRHILAYHIISQVGFMVAGVGIGTALAINGTTAHAFSHILYKALLFMGAGAVLQATGRSKLTELGGLVRTMPWTLAFFAVGALSISGAPLFNGFVSKSIIIGAAGYEGLYAAKFLLLLASVGTFLSIGLKLLYFTWFGTDRGLRPANLPFNMLMAMGILSLICFWHGIQPAALYQLLPHAMDYAPYTIPHTVEAVQLLTFTFVAFWLLRKKYQGEPCIALDTDWFYRRPAPLARVIFVSMVNRCFDVTQDWADRIVARVAVVSKNPMRLWLRKQPPEFDPDRDRFPLNNSLGLTLAIVVIVTIWALL
jgi:multicomponent Na+:H+ antiporter subunit D